MSGNGHKIWQRFLFRLRNKYFVIGVLFVLWLLIFDSSNLIDKRKAKRRIANMNKEMEYYRAKIENDSQKIQELRTNTENLEKFAREQYLMKRPNEELFIIDESKL